MHKIKKGDRVAYTTTGRYPKHVEGVVTGEHNGWLLVTDAAGKERKTRPGAVRVA